MFNQRKTWLSGVVAGLMMAASVTASAEEKKAVSNYFCTLRLCDNPQAANPLPVCAVCGVTHGERGAIADPSPPWVIRLFCFAGEQC
ncbi:MAG: hypothetical protein ACR5LF_13905 [Symbiopectobacterium sp.]